MIDKHGLKIQVGDGIRVVDCSAIVVVFEIHESEDCISYITRDRIVCKSSKGKDTRSLIGNVWN